ncbi:MAG: hypothetical protein ACJ763_01455 [Bdellovibrionia bacterium]
MMVATTNAAVLFLLSTLLLPAYAATSNAWKITVYYTAVESFHHHKKTKVRGCSEMGCRWKSNLGEYPADFVKAVKDEGTGRITSGEHAGKYLCWSRHDGYWLDSAPRDASGKALTSWESAAADSSVMSFGTGFQVVDCGVDDMDGAEINPQTCAQIKNVRWKITDRFEAGLGGRNHLDLYIGEEDQEDFVNKSPKVISAKSASISFD